MKIVLLNPNILGDYRKSKVTTCNLGIAYLSSFLKKNNNCVVKIIDARAYGYTPEEVCKKIIKIQPDLIGFSLLVDETTNWTNDVLVLLKQNKINAHITLGGYFPSLFTEKALRNIVLADTAIIGEGEIPLSQLVECLKKKINYREILGLAYKNENNEIIINPSNKLIENLDNLPFPDRYLFKKNDDNIEIMIESTRGCLFNCSFCAVQPFYKLSKGKKLRIRSASHLFSEIEYLNKVNPNNRNFRFIDSEFVAFNTNQRALDFANMLINSQLDVDLMMDSRATSILNNKEIFKLLAKAGLKRIYLGIESGSDKILKKMNKGCSAQNNIDAVSFLKEIDVDYSYGFMMITPWSEEEDIEKNINLLEQIGRMEFRCLYHEMTLVPNTLAFEEVEKSKKLIWKGSLSYYTYESSSEKIQRYRKLFNEILKIEPLYFGHIPGYIYESIRQLRRKKINQLANQLEILFNKLLLEIFYDCWNYCSLKNSDNLNFILSLKKNVIPKFINILKVLDEKIKPEFCSKRLPIYAPKKQI